MTRPPVRAMWTYPGAFQDAAQSQRTLAAAKAAGLNRLLLLVYSAGRAQYPSRVAPSRVADGSPDALSRFITRAHKEGLEVYAYLATLVGRTRDATGTILAAHPDWVMFDDRGRKLSDYTPSEMAADWLEAVWLDPGHPEVGDYLERLYSEVLERYDLDGVQLDFIRYPSTHAFSTGLYYPPNRTFGYNPAALAAYRIDGGSDPLELLRQRRRHVQEMGEAAYERACWQWDEWRRERITGIVRRVRQARDRLRPAARLSASVIPFPERAYLTFYQDWPGWLESGLVDEVYLMSYTIDGRLFSRQLRQAVEFAPQPARVIAGVGVYKNLADPDQLLRQMRFAQTHAGGWSLFSARNLLGDEELWEVVRTAGGSR
ncbi:family 10 glycosylhydrolase [bacterium]|nr:family 10 glycosylhydrolase [bacterium]